jgi:hypothetical protein
MTSWSQGNTFTAARGLPFNMGWCKRHNPSTTNLTVSLLWTPSVVNMLGDTGRSTTSQMRDRDRV